MSYVWIGSHGIERAVPRQSSEGVWKRLWDHGWGLLFVVAMTLLSILGPRTAYSKLPPAQAVNSAAVHSIK